MHNSQAIALNEFITNYDEYAKDKFGTHELSKDEMIQKIIDTAKGGHEKLTTN
jgi:hypothetical protein